MRARASAIWGESLTLPNARPMSGQDFQEPFRSN
jgi:hypothetical protein